MTIEVTYTYEVERINGQWVVFECSQGMEEEIFASSDREEIRAFMRDLQGA